MKNPNHEWYLRHVKVDPGETPSPPRKIIQTDQFVFVERTMQSNGSEAQIDLNEEVSEEEALARLYFGSPQKTATRVIIEMLETLIQRSYGKDRSVCDETVLDYEIQLQSARTIAQTLMLIKENSGEARHLWDELGKIYRMISALRMANSDDQSRLRDTTGVSHAFSMHTGSIVGHVLGVQRELSVKRGVAGKIGAGEKKKRAIEWKDLAKPLVEEILKEKDRNGKPHTALSVAHRLIDICEKRSKMPDAHIPIPKTDWYIARWIREIICAAQPEAPQQSD